MAEGDCRPEQVAGGQERTRVGSSELQRQKTFFFFSGLMGSLLLLSTFFATKHVGGERAMRPAIQKNDWMKYTHTRGDWQLFFLMAFLNF